MPVDGGYEPVRPSIVDHPRPVVTNHWYCTWSGARRDFIEGAQASADVTRKDQMIHFHSEADQCDKSEHLLIGPSEPRSTAVGGREHRG